jgi:hypothetical protein
MKQYRIFEYSRDAGKTASAVHKSLVKKISVRPFAAVKSRSWCTKYARLAPPPDDAPKRKRPVRA